MRQKTKTGLQSSCATGKERSICAKPLRCADKAACCRSSLAQHACATAFQWKSNQHLISLTSISKNFKVYSKCSNVWNDLFSDRHRQQFADDRNQSVVGGVAIELRERQRKNFEIRLPEVGFPSNDVNTAIQALRAIDCWILQVDRANDR
jgi:hypothetical protein